MNDNITSAIVKLNNISDNISTPVTLPPVDSWPETVHLFDEKSLWALKAGLAAGRPLLIRGEPGTGKSQLARAAAHVLDRAFAFEVVHARSEFRDLQYSFDAVSRLGEAQTLGASGKGTDVQAALDPLKFLCPGILWWAFDWTSAQKQYGASTHKTRKPSPPNKDWKPENGVVVLIDEIDKADSDLPNGLLETLGNGMFTVPYLTEGSTIGISPETPPPLVIVTTNEERELPQAFIRRCMVLYLELPGKKDDLVPWLVNRGTIHFPGCSDEVLDAAAEQLWQDRRDALETGLPAPGQAEYLDILRAVTGISEDETEQVRVLEAVRDFALKKHPKDTY